jgi:creatinine amidohydrolase
MRYELMLPWQIRRAIEENTPVVLPLGVLEYHGEHLGVGLDTLVVVRCVERLEAEGLPLVILPPFYYGAGSYVVEGPEGKGTVQVDSNALAAFAKELFIGLLRIGFRNIHGFIHHQSENFLQGMPTDLAFRLGARQATFEILGRERGDGWWGNEEMADYYAGHAAGANPFNWIRIHPLMDDAIIASYEFDHAGIGETSLLMALDPAGVDMEKFSGERWYLRGADQATASHGEEAVGRILARMRRLLGKESG